MFVLFTNWSKLERKQNKQRVNSGQTVSKQGEPIARVLPYLKFAFGVLGAFFGGVGQVKDRLAIRIPPQYIQKDRVSYSKGQDYTNGQIVYIPKDIRLVQRDRQAIPKDRLGSHRGDRGWCINIMNYTKGYITYPKASQCNKKQYFAYPFGYIIIPYCIIYLVITDSQLKQKY